MSIASRLDLDEYLAKFEACFAREKEYILQGDINNHFRYIKELEKIEFTPPPQINNLDTSLMHLQKQGVLNLDDIYEFIKILNYFSYLKTLEFEGMMHKWLREIVFVHEVIAIGEYFTKKGVFDLHKDSTLYGLDQAYRRNKEEIKHKIYGIANGASLQSYLVDRQVHYQNQQECLLVRGGFNHVLKANIIGRSSGGFFYVVPHSISKLKENQSGILNKIEQIKFAYAKEFSATLSNNLPFLKFINKAFDRFDHYQARVNFAKQNDYNFILPSAKKGVHLSEFLHPALSEGVSSNIVLDKKVMIVTGVNAGGKTMLLKSILAAVFLSKYLLPMRCNAHKTKIGHYRSIEAIIDDPQSVKNDISTFAGRMLEFSKMFHKNGSIVGVDEIELGTDSDEAASLFKVILTKLMHKDITLIVTTHHKRLASLMAAQEEVELVAAIYDKKKQLPTYEFLQGSIGKSYAFETAQRYGIPKAVVSEAKEVFGQDKERLNELIEKSTTLEANLRKKISQADKRLAQLDKKEKELHEKQMQMQLSYQKKLADYEKGYEEAKQVLKDAIKGDQKQKHRALNEADKTKKALRQKEQKPQKTVAQTLEIGDWVKYNNSKGVITKLSKNKAFVQIEGMTLQVKKGVLTKVPKPKEKQSISVKVSKESGSVKLDLHGMRYEQAREELENFIATSLLHSFDEVFVYHGVGSGALARMVKEFCKTHPKIQGCEDAPPNLGGVGATIIKL